MNIAEILILKFPDADFFSDIILQDDGEGPYIKEWNIEGVTKPTKSDITKWEAEADALLINRQNEEYNKTLIEQLEAIDLKSIRALRTNDTIRLEELEKQAVELRGKFK